MSTIYNTRIVTDGLVLYVDAANPKSWTGSGSTWFDLSPSGNHMTLVGSPTKGSNNGGVVQFGITQYAYNTTSFFTKDSTVMGAARYSGASNRGRIISSYITNWLLGHWSGTTENYYGNGWISGIGVGTGDTNWRILTAVNSYSTDIWTSYVNATQTYSNSSGVNGPDGLQLNGLAGAAASERSDSEVGFLMVYDRVLSTAEIQQNHNAMRSRFSI
jgi:hypothetical protein